MEPNKTSEGNFIKSAYETGQQIRNKIESVKQNMKTEKPSFNVSEKDVIPRKVAALEVYRVWNVVQNVSFMGILACPLVMLLTVETKYTGSKVGGAAAVIVAMVLAYFLSRAMLKKKYLNDEYNLKILKGN